MHSSRMRTGCSLTSCRSLLLGGGGGLCFLGGVCFLGGSASKGGLLLGEVSASWRGVCFLGGCLLPGGVCFLGGLGSAPGGCASWGVFARGVCSWGVCSWGCGIPTCTEADTPPVDRITDACKNITLATTSLQPVKIRIIG